MKNKLHLSMQHLLPQHFLSRLAGKLCECEIPYIKDRLITRFIKQYNVNMSEAIYENPQDYRHFNDFFTRKLKPHAREVNLDPATIISPVDGRISQIGAIKTHTLFQAKGKEYSLLSLLGNADISYFFENGYFATLYLAPKDYHRIHMPISGQLLKMIHIPGKLFSVNPYTASRVDNLFARNERVICLFETSLGKMAVILVGAFFVASISTVWAGLITPPTKTQLRTWDYKDTAPILLKKGDELGFFQLGSTVILLLPSNSITWNSALHADSPLKMGQPIGTLLA